MKHPPLLNLLLHLNQYIFHQVQSKLWLCTTCSPSNLAILPLINPYSNSINSKKKNIKIYSIFLLTQFTTTTKSNPKNPLIPLSLSLKTIKKKDTSIPFTQKTTDPE